MTTPVTSLPRSTQLTVSSGAEGRSSAVPKAKVLTVDDDAFVAVSLQQLLALVDFMARSAIADFMTCMGPE